MGLGLKDEKGKPIIYNYPYFDIVKKTLHMKAKWMISEIESLYPSKGIIIFFDEPSMVSFGSAYVSISKDDIISLLNEVLAGLHAKRGIHCCGNTDWSVLLNVDIDIINYDAYNFLETIFYFKEDLTRFLRKGGWVSPGIVPSSEKVLDISLNDILKLWKTFIAHMNEINIPAKDKEWLITTSCGLGSLQTSETRRAMELLKELSETLPKFTTPVL
jgi:methionine synthase II (cobalamin-independent)